MEYGRVRHDLTWDSVLGFHKGLGPSTGGDETRNARAFRKLSSLVPESDSYSRDSFWLSSSRILLPTTIPLSPPMSEQSKPRQAAQLEGTRPALAVVLLASRGGYARANARPGRTEALGQRNPNP